MHSTPGTSRRVVSWAVNQPGWVARAASVAALLVLSVVVLLLVIPALIVGALVFLLLSLYAAIWFRIAAWRAGHGRESGRENVRVIGRDDQQRR